MSLSLTVVQRLLVFSALLWAILPVWGGFAFGASWLLLIFATRARTRRAAALVEANVEHLRSLPPEGQALVRRFSLAYVWPQSAEAWGGTWQMTGLLALLLAGAFGLRALLTWDAWPLFFLGPLTVQLLAGGGMARRLKANERVREDLKDQRLLHDTITTLLRLKSAAGFWPPEASPDPAVEKRS